MTSDPSSMNRRQFLGRATGGAAGLAFASSLLGACAAPPPAAAPTAAAKPTTAAAPAPTTPPAAPPTPPVAPTAATKPTAPPAAASTPAPANTAPTTAAQGAGTPTTATKLSQFKAFVPSDAVGSIPSLPKRMAYTVPTADEYFSQLSSNVEAACKDNGVEYNGLVLSDGDPVKNISLINQLLQRGVGGLMIQPEDSKAQGEVIRKMIPTGVCVFFSGAPATIQGMADQYDLGYTQAIGAVDWIKENLGGKAKVVNFTLDHIEILIPRRQGTLDGLKTGGPGIEVVFEQELQKTNTDEGFQFASTIYQAHPDVNVWIGPDDTVLGVDAFLKSKGLDPNKEVILASGLNGVPSGLDAVAGGQSFMRQAYGFNNSLIGYSVGAFVADWLAGKQVPQVIQVRTVTMKSKADVERFRAATKDPREAYRNLRAGKESSAALWGNISYDTKETYTANIVSGS